MTNALLIKIRGVGIAMCVAFLALAGAQAVSAQEATEDISPAPEIYSAIFLDSESWYAVREATFTWEVPAGVEKVAVDIVDAPDTEPMTSYTPPIGELTLDHATLTDGVHYVALQFKDASGWGAVTYKKLMIDTVPPLPFDIRVETENGAPRLIFGTTDDLSGIDVYEVRVGGDDPFHVTLAEAEAGYVLSSYKDGVYPVFVTAYDRAGNTITAYVHVSITAGWTSAPPTAAPEADRLSDALQNANIVILILSLIIVMLMIQYFRGQRRLALRERRLMKETEDIRDQTQRIFSALRAEMHAQIAAITKSKRLTKKNKEAVDNMTEALAMSETLIGKEIADVAKAIKE